MTFVGINVTDGAQNTWLSQRVSENGIKQSMDPVDLEKSIAFYGIQSGKVKISIYTDPRHFIESSQAPRTVDSSNRNIFTSTCHRWYMIFIHVKYHSTDIEEEHQVESMNRYHMVNKHFCKIQRQVLKYTSMEL